MVFVRNKPHKKNPHTLGNGMAIAKWGSKAEARYRQRRLRDAADAMRIGVSEEFQRVVIPAYIRGDGVNG